MLIIHCCAEGGEAESCNGHICDGVELAGLLARVRAVLPVQEGDGELQVLDRRVMSDRVPVHVQGEILPCPFQLNWRASACTSALFFASFGKGELDC